MQAIGEPYPAAFTFNAPERVANWRPLVHWLLAIPHLLVVGVLRYAAQVLALVCWFIILFTGRLPRELANFQVMYLRYYVRTVTYVAFLLEEYPPFTFAMTPQDPGDDPRVQVEVIPQLEQRNRVTVGFRFILVIPQLIVLALLAIAAWFVLVIAVLRGAVHRPMARRTAAFHAGRHAVVATRRGVPAAAHRRVPAVRA